MESSIFFQQVINGLVIGSIYAMVALGLTLIFGILHIGNFAHGQLYMLGAFATYWLVTLWGWNIWSSMLVAMGSMALLGIVLERVVFRPVYSAPHINGLIVALGLFIALENIALILWGGEERTLPSPYATKVITLLSISLTLQRLLVFIISILLIFLLYLFIQRTKMGKAIRAVAQDPEVSRLMGIPIHRISATVFAVSSALAAAAGALVGPIFCVFPAMGVTPILKAFVVIVLGGMGSIPGAIFGGFILGIAESLGAGYLSSEYKDAFAFAALILVLMVKPSGLFGKE
jgi:branched-chain amino acid transport system permease protein